MPTLGARLALAMALFDPCHKMLDSTICLSRRRLRLISVTKGVELNGGSRLEPSGFLGSVSRWGTDACIVKVIQAPDQHSLSNIAVKAQSEATHGPSRSLKLMELVTAHYYHCSNVPGVCGTSEYLCRVSNSAFIPALAVRCKEAVHS